MGITQKDIARDLGISFMTVSRALNNTGYVSERMKHKILAYAEEVGYEPHRASQVLVRNEKKTIVLFSSSLPRYFWDEIEKGVQVAAQQLKAFNYVVRYHRVPEQDTKTYHALLEQELNNGVDGIAVVNQRKYDMTGIFERIEKSGVPFITFNIDAPESQRLFHVGTDYKAGGRLAADFIARALQLSPKREVLVLQCYEENQVYQGPDINHLRLQGFMDLMHESFPQITVVVQFFNTRLLEDYHDNQIHELIAHYQDKVQAIYFPPAFNTEFLNALEAVKNPNIITVLHDLDSKAIHHLKTRLLSAVIDQSPTLQGYYAVKVLEKIIESKDLTDLSVQQIDHNLVLAENNNLIHGLLSVHMAV